MGQKPGVVEIAGETVTDVGVDPDLAAARLAVRPEAVAARIEKVRKGGLTVRVVDAAGRPVPNASVHLAMTRHAFLFGCNFFGLNPADTSPSELAYQKEFTALFNYGTLPFYWSAFELSGGKPDYDRLQGMAQWSVAHGITPKGHPLVWHEAYPDWAPRTPDAAIPLLHARVADLVPRYKDTIHYWDVLNEANAASSHSPVNGESAWITRDGPAPVVETALGWARAARPAGTPETFLYNDYNTGQENVALLTQLQKDGKLPDAIGLQSHMHGGEFPLPDVWLDCQRFARFGRPIHFTETTVISGPRRDNPNNGYLPDWNTTPEGEAKQAEYVAQFYALLFSHPSVRAITWWDFQRPERLAGRPGGPGPQGHVPQARLHPASGPHPQTVVDRHDREVRRAGDSDPPRLLRRLRRDGHGREGPDEDAGGGSARGRPGADGDGAPAVRVPPPPVLKADGTPVPARVGTSPTPTRAGTGVRPYGEGPKNAATQAGSHWVPAPSERIRRAFSAPIPFR